MAEVFDTTCVTNEHARVPAPTYQGDASRINLEEDSSEFESQGGQDTPLVNRAKRGKRRKLMHISMLQIFSWKKYRDVFSSLVS